MSSFTESALTKKLVDLNPSQQSEYGYLSVVEHCPYYIKSLLAIQTLSLWLIHHRKHHENIVKLWLKELISAPKNKKLTFMFLANDVIQNSKRKGPEYSAAFSKVLVKAFAHIREACAGTDQKTIDSLDRILNIWLDRHVYEETHIKSWRKALTGSEERRGSSNGDSSSSSEKKRKHEDTSVAAVKKSKTPSKDPHAKSEVVEVNGTKELHVTLSPHEAFGDPPEPEELIRALQEIENSASSDVAVRQKIANLPLEYTEVSMLSKLENKEAALKLAEQVSDAVKLLNDYNSRLCGEMEDRKRLQVMLKDFAQEQKELVSQAESRLQEYGKKLAKVKEVQREIKNHLRNLPDVQGEGLAPLPSPGDLFSAH